MSGRVGRDGDRDGDDAAPSPSPKSKPDLTDEVVSYWSSGTFVVQTGTGKLLIASDTVVPLER